MVINELASEVVDYLLIFWLHLTGQDVGHDQLIQWNLQIMDKLGPQVSFTERCPQNVHYSEYFSSAMETRRGMSIYTNYQPGSYKAS